MFDYAGEAIRWKAPMSIPMVNTKVQQYARHGILGIECLAWYARYGILGMVFYVWHANHARLTGFDNCLQNWRQNWRRCLSKFRMDVLKILLFGFESARDFPGYSSLLSSERTVNSQGEELSADMNRSELFVTACHRLLKTNC